MKTREPWLAVDPILLRGDIEYDLARLLWTRLDGMISDDEIVLHFETVVSIARLDRSRAWRWVLFRSMDYWLWELDNGVTYDPRRCQRLMMVFMGCGVVVPKRHQN
jgi:streptomycin 6-kinase